MLIKNNLREKLKKGELVISMMLRFADTATAEMMAHCGVDLIIVDNEHYPFNPEKMIDIARAVNAAGSQCVVRLPNCEPARIAQVMDYGMAGILIPSVDTYEEAMQLVNAVKFAPVGTRGFCPITRAAAYGYGMSPTEFAQYSNETSLVMVQIETKEGIENLDKILSIPEVDHVTLGPSDISASYGLPGQYDHPVVKEAIATARRKIIAAGKPGGGMYHTPGDVKAAFDAGDRVISIGSDQQILMNRLAELVKAAKG